MNILCGNCEKDSGVVREISDGVNACNLQKAGFIAKLPVMVGIPEWLFTCSEECKTELFARKCEEYNVSAEAKAEAAEQLKKLKAKLPQMVKDTCEFMGKVQKVFSKIPRKGTV